MPRKALNNPRQIESKSCGCPNCLVKYPPEEYGERRPRRDCIGSWQARYRDPTGRQKSRNFAIKDGGKKAAEAFLDKTRTAVRDRTYRDPERGKITLGAWWKEFWEVESTKGTIRTRNRKISLWRAHIGPKWADYRLIDLEYMALQKWHTQLKGHRTQKQVRLLFIALLDAAIRDGERISVNPARLLEVTAPKRAKHPDDLKPPTKAQYALIHAALPEYYQRILRDFAYETGMRPGEYAGIRLHCVDEEQMVVHIKEILVLDNGRLCRQEAPKTEAGFRTVALTPTALEAIRWMKAKWKPKATRSVIGDDPYDLHTEELVFRGPKGAALNVNNLQRPWKRATDQAGVTRKVWNPDSGKYEWWPRLYEYRHDVATRLHHAGVAEVDTQAHLGQKRGGKVTWIYTHGSEDARERVRAALTGEGGEGSGLRAVE